MNIFQPQVFMPQITSNELEVFALDAEPTYVVFNGLDVIPTSMIPLTQKFTEANALAMARDYGYQSIYVLDANRLLHYIDVESTMSVNLGKLQEITLEQSLVVPHYIICNERFFASSASLEDADLPV